MKVLERITKRQWMLMSYLILHMIWYMIMEQVNVGEYTLIYSPLDDLIPFVPWLVVPYLLWFPYMLVSGIYFLLKDSEAFEKYLLALFTGFFFSMLTVTFFPTGQELRLDVSDLGGPFGWILRFIYGFDTNTNIMPSMHVVGALAVAFSVDRSKSLGRIPLVRAGNWILCVLIVASTVCLKQHSILDVFAASLLEIPIVILAQKGILSKLLDKLTGTQRDF